jgi:ABC-type transporter Mla subunit MlaD
MPLESTDIDAKLEQLSATLRSSREQVNSIRQQTNATFSTMAQVDTNFADLLAAIAEIKDSTNQVDKMQVAKMNKMNGEVNRLKAKISSIKQSFDAIEE